MQESNHKKILNKTEQVISANGKDSNSHGKMLLNLSQSLASYKTLDEMLAALGDIFMAELDASRTTVFLHDAETKELYSRIAFGTFHHEIRIPDDKGIAGAVFSSGKACIVLDPYAQMNILILI
jgi:adenylate cyclase